MNLDIVKVCYCAIKYNELRYASSQVVKDNEVGVSQIEISSCQYDMKVMK